MQDYTIPLPSGLIAVIRLPSPMSEEDFNLLAAALVVLKPGFLAASSAQVKANTQKQEPSDE